MELEYEGAWYRIPERLAGIIARKWQRQKNEDLCKEILDSQKDRIKNDYNMDSYAAGTYVDDIIQDFEEGTIVDECACCAWMESINRVLSKASAKARDHAVEIVARQTLEARTDVMLSESDYRKLASGSSPISVKDVTDAVSDLTPESGRSEGHELDYAVYDKKTGKLIASWQ